VTLREYALVARGRQRMLVDQHNDRAWLALQLVALQRQKRLPKLKTLLMPYTARRHQTRDEQRRMVRLIAETFKERN
jgi:hypothetical protein